jgi:hypothetical protein
MVRPPGTKVPLPQIPIVIRLEPLGLFVALLGPRIQPCNVANIGMKIQGDSYRRPAWLKRIIS